ncbi:Phosphotransferase [Vibrio jasicida]|uniref:Phosphotransferase n=1 Tax=Vibrio jasicida TaxID=766224 RepID=A0AAU9QI84_9VIBR|nr:Phosphotransferase [Vibrio jasicida]CAH1578738.1 Phosphotransferase [Vibrio jasicida]
METLQGGREGAIYRKGDLVSRPASLWTITIHQLLHHLHANGFHACPKAVSIEGGKELLTFVDGESYNYPLQGEIASLSALTSAAKLLRQLHDASQDFLSRHQDEVCHWMLPTRLPHEVICHGDFMPYNVALKDGAVVGIFDFDTAHPAPRIWDVAFSVYGCSRLEREELVDTMTLRLIALVDFMRTSAATGDAQFQANMDDCHHMTYLQDIEYLKKHHQAITLGVLGEAPF